MIEYELIKKRLQQWSCTESASVTATDDRSLIHRMGNGTGWFRRKPASTPCVRALAPYILDVRRLLALSAPPMSDALLRLLQSQAAMLLQDSRDGCTYIRCHT